MVDIEFNFFLRLKLAGNQKYARKFHDGEVREKSVSKEFMMGPCCQSRTVLKYMKSRYNRRKSIWTETKKALIWKTMRNDITAVGKWLKVRCNFRTINTAYSSLDFILENGYHRENWTSKRTVLSKKNTWDRNKTTHSLSDFPRVA